MNMSPNNMPPVVSPANMGPNAGPNMMPNMMPNVMVANVTENNYVYPYATKPMHHQANNDWAFLLVLFILLVIILRGTGHFGGKC